MKAFNSRGLKIMYHNLDTDTLKNALLEIGEKPEKETKVAMIKAFGLAAAKHSNVAEFLGKFKRETLSAFGNALGFKVKSTDKTLVESALLEEIIIEGILDSFDKMSKEFTTDVAKELGLKYNLGGRETAYLILGSSYPHVLKEFEEQKAKLKIEREANKNKPKVEKVKKPPRIAGQKPWVGVKQPALKKGITKEELTQYWTEQLKDFCVKNGLKTTGKKTDLMKRIHLFLETGKVEEGGKKRKIGGEKTSNKKKKTEEPKKEAPVVQAPEVVKEAPKTAPKGKKGSK